MIQSICILGRQAEIGRAELESLYGAAAITPLGKRAAGLALPATKVVFARLGGSTKLGTVVAEIPSTQWNVIEKELQKFVRSSAFALPTSGKFHLGLSAFGLAAAPPKLNALGLTLKKLIRSRHDGSVRLVPSTDTELSTAQVFHNHLAHENGAELLLIAHNEMTLVARTVAVQDIDSYTLRDRGRPKRDARVGMLPPKLAQIILNLAVGETSDKEPRSKTILDPFCGTGVTLQEALLMGYSAYGTDLEPRMIDYTRVNLEWLQQQFPRLETLDSKLEPADATTHTWFDDARRPKPDALFVACETYLGRPFTEIPERAVLEQTVSEVNTIIKKFLVNLHSQIPHHTRLCLAVPAWHIETRGSKLETSFRHLPALDELPRLGYKRVVFRHASWNDLVYHREGQVVGRELVTLVRE